MPLVFTKEMKNKNEKYIDFDGAGIIYPYVANNNWNNVYRIEAMLKCDVKLSCLKDAVKQMRSKYPYFFSRVSVVKNKFVLKSAYSGNIVTYDTSFCNPFDLKNSEALVRIVYSKKTIGAEFFHGITDGYGAKLFFNELLKEYCNYVFSKYGYDYQNTNILPVNDNLLKTTDIFNEIYNLGGRNVNRFLNKSYQFKEKNRNELSVNSICVSSGILKSVAHKYGASVTQYLCAVQIFTIMETQNVKGKTIRISIPVNIRKYFNIDTVRNASLYILIEINPKQVTDFNSVIESVKSQFASKLTKENMQNLAFSNVKCAKMKAFNILPIGFKKVALNIGYTAFGEDQFTSILTNLGIIDFDSNVQNIVSSVYYVLGKEKTKPLNLTVSSYENQIKIIVSSVIDSSKFIFSFCNTLAADGIGYNVVNFNKKSVINPTINIAS